MLKITGLEQHQQQPMSSSVCVLKVTYKLQEDKDLHIYLKAISPTYEYVKTQIKAYFVDLYQLQPGILRIYWVDEECDEIEIFNQHDYEIFMVTCSERRRLFVAPITAVDKDFSEEADEMKASASEFFDTNHDIRENDLHNKPRGLNEGNDNYKPWDEEEVANSVQKEAAVDLNTSYATHSACSSDVIANDAIPETNFVNDLPEKPCGLNEKIDNYKPWDEEKAANSVQEEAAIDNDGSSEIDFVSDLHEKPCGLHGKNDNYKLWEDEEMANNVQEEAAIDDDNDGSLEIDLVNDLHEKPCGLYEKNDSDTSWDDGDSLQEEAAVNLNTSCATHLAHDDENDACSEIDFVNDVHEKPCGLYEKNDNYTPWDDEEVANDVRGNDVDASSDNEDKNIWDSFVKVESTIPAEGCSNGKNADIVIVEDVAASDSAEVTNERTMSGISAEGVASSGNNVIEAPIEIVYHADEFINSGVKVLLNMGFSNEFNRLVQVLLSVEGIIPAALDLL
ncbi:uncharacterized protein LOC119643920 [Glossina fuscipes]|uniref:Uncharacterized protein LOC119643920 n=1 Tax=Glossina fuscipes TaxID=7396 RepID=A0A9C6DQF5_9MUSC|nr:uncharacterized protein LOC119643920 [Glossina fuscipes]